MAERERVREHKGQRVGNRKGDGEKDERKI